MDVGSRLDSEDASIPRVQRFAVVPVPKPRMTVRDKWERRPAVQRYRDYCDLLRLHGARLPSMYAAAFEIPMPRTWSPAMRAAMVGTRHLSQPDASNCVKALEDALVPEDQVLHCIAASKSWAETPRITIYNIAAAGEEGREALLEWYQTARKGAAN